MRVGILTSGGDAPGINATIRGVGKTAINHYGMQVIGIQNGFSGLLYKDTIELTDASLSGCLLYTSRMKYYLVAGEASGDLHASNLMRSLKGLDEGADFRFFGGDLMQAVGGTLVKHYREMAFMGFLPVILNEMCIRDSYWFWIM